MFGDSPAQVRAPGQPPNASCQYTDPDNFDLHLEVQFSPRI